MFRPAAAVGLFSKREEESIELLDFRLKGIYAHLPEFLRNQHTLKNNKKRWTLSNGSMAMAFPTTGGRSYTFSLALVDEADFQPSLAELQRSVKPTIDAGGQQILLSTSDKGKPASEFKQIYRAARRGKNDYKPIFLPWDARPTRTIEWYEREKESVVASTGALDDLHQEYPSSDAEALAPRSLDKRIPPAWLSVVFEELDPIECDAPALPELEVFKAPDAAKRYIVGADPAEGNPTSDDSALEVVEYLTGEQVATLAGKFQPAQLAAYADSLGRFYNNAGIMVERNNHGHAVILWLLEHSVLRLLPGHDGREGWLSSPLGKTLLYNNVADTVKNEALFNNRLIHHYLTYAQLASIEGATLRAPEGEHDDRADAYALADVGRAQAAMMDGWEENEGIEVYEDVVTISPV